MDGKIEWSESDLSISNQNKMINHPCPAQYEYDPMPFGSLCFKYKRIICLKAQKYSYKEIAEIMNMPTPEAARALMARARKEYKKRAGKK